MKILHFTHTYIPIFGGTTTRLMNLFQNDGNQHTMIVPQVGSSYVPNDITDLNQEDRYDNVSIKRIGLTVPEKDNRFFFEYKIRLTNWARNASELLGFNDSGPFNLVYGHNPMEFALAASRYSSSKDIPLIYECHGLMSDSLPLSRNPIKRIYNQIGNWWLTREEKEIIQRAAKVVVQTNSMKSRLEKALKIPSERLAVVYNGVDVDFFKAGISDNEINKIRIDLKAEDKTIFSYFGFLDHNNGIGFFLNSLSKLPENIKKKVKILIVGRGPLAAPVRAFSENNNFLVYQGLVDYRKIPLYYQASDVFVIPRPSNLATETLLPMKLLEAMAMEKLVLVSDVSGMTEVVRHEQNGLVFKHEDQQDFLSAMTTIIENFRSLQAIRKQARETVLTDFNWSGARKILSDLYEKILN
jgi:glycosyltransferase involved in cell wall biosynthesis